GDGSDAMPKVGSPALPVINSTIKRRGCCWMRSSGRFLRSVFSKIASLAREVRQSRKRGYFGRNKVSDSTLLLSNKKVEATSQKEYTRSFINGKSRRAKK